MDSLIMKDEHLDTIQETESDEFIKSSVEGLVQNPSESEDERECDVPDCDDSQTTNFSTFSNPLYDEECDQLIFDEPYCANCGGPHMTFQCQPMNYYEPNPCYDSNYSGFDQIEPSQFPVIHQPPQEMSMEALQAREDLMKSIENFLKKFNRISFRETPKVLMQAWDKFLEIKHACKEKQHQSEEVQELLNKLLQDLQSINEELAEFINTPSWNLPTSSYDDDDDEYSFATQEYLMTCSTAITPDSPKTDSLIMEDEHLDTIPETESDEFIKSSVEDILPTHPTLHMDFDFIPSHNDLDPF
ncbi:hypothetical protein Tco_0575777 [Tanacetum coccineum]